MTLKAVSTSAGRGAAGSADVADAVRELQGVRQDVATGAAANTKINVAAMRQGDHIVSAIAHTDAGGAPVNDAANLTIQDTHATGTITVAAVADGDAVNVNGTTFTFKTSPTLANHVKIGVVPADVPATNTLNALNLSKAINGYPFRYGGAQVKRVTATPAAAVVTVRAVVDSTAGNAYVLTSTTGVRLAVSGAGTLTGGTATGGIKSTTNLTGKTLVILWIKKP